MEFGRASTGFGHKDPNDQRGVPEIFSSMAANCSK